MRKILSFLVLALFMTVTAGANGTKVGDLYYLFDGTNATVTYTGENTSSSDYTGDIIIPSTVESGGITYTVTAIGQGAFANSTITSIEIPNTVTTVGGDACAYIGSTLKTVIIGSGVTSFSQGFCWSTRPTDVYVKTTTVPSIGNYMFSGSPTIHVYPNLQSKFSTSGWNSYGTIVGDLEKDYTYAELQAKITELQAVSAYVGTNPGFYTAASYANVQAAIDNTASVNSSSPTSVINTAMKNLISAQAALAITPVTEGYYYLVCDNANIAANGKSEKALYLNASSNELFWGEFQEGNPRHVFKFIDAGEGTFYLQSFDNDLYVGGAQEFTVSFYNTTTPEYPASFFFDGEGSWRIKTNNWTFCPQGNHSGTANGPLRVWSYNAEGMHGEASYQIRAIDDEVITNLTARKELITYLSSIADQYNQYLLGKTTETETLVNTLESAYTAAQTAVNANASTAEQYQNYKSAVENAMAALADFVPAGFWQRTRISYADIADGDLISFEAAAAKGQAGMFLTGNITTSDDLYGLLYTDMKWTEDAIWQIVSTGTQDSKGNDTYYLKQYSTGYYSSNQNRGMREDVSLARKYAFVSPTVGNTKRIVSSNWDDNSVVIQDWANDIALDCLVGKAFVYMYGAGDAREDNVWNPYRLVWNTDIYAELANAIDVYGELEALVGIDPGLYDESSAKAIAYINAIETARAMDGTTAKRDVRTAIDNLKSAYNALLAESVLPITEGWYYITNAATRADNKVMSAVIDPAVSTTDLRWTILDEKDANQIFYLAPSGTDWTMKCMNGYYVSKAAGNAGSKIPVSDTAEPQKFYDKSGGRFFWTDSYDYTSCYPRGYITYAYYSFRADPDLNATSGVMNNWAAKTDPYENNMYVNLWHLHKADVAELTIGATGYSTYVSDKALIVPEGVTANGVTGLDGSDVELTQLSGNVLAADEPVILQGEAGKKFYFIATDEIGNSIAGNLLEGTGTEGKSIGANEAYVLYNNEGTAVFRIAGAMTLPAHKAYLPAGVVNGAGAKEFGLGGLTGINNAQTSNLESQTYFDLQGRKVAAPQKGQLYIVNGKKVLY